MKTIFITLVTLCLFINAHCSDTSYYVPLKNSLNLADAEYEAENFQQLANCCERILSIYKSEWLPYYYEAYAYINLSFIEKNSDKKKAYCDRAQNFIDSAFKIRPNESELYVLQCLLYYARMEISPMINGAIYFPKTSKALEEAEKLNPKNPRIYYLKGKSTMYTPKFMGGGKASALPFFEKALQMYDNFEPESIVHPYWGKEDAEKLYFRCKTDTL